MLALVSSSSASEIGVCVFEKNVGDVLSRAVGNRHVQRDDVDADTESLLCPERDGRGAGEEHGKRETTGHLFPPVRVRARTVSPGRLTETAIFSGGINVSGRA
jgi:hypothetical protein